ncbi:TPA: diphthamide biosynthesis enzyme Dph2 [archaeon]|uniref:2-(3-amino-3-carboxypropyl)histidine synthase n=1 Tax=Candidatus Naiadarchaeum limnaeum TaxID=2756139 RepID=A0A832V2U8_9ARCH|nr:diphthamide biosynthesis enzyme Dph2 [Candidatus Naiadarchaeales archaeon SRR2090153.bin1042]HIJ99981.1 diphthamide biosynthesis enzyme Dph2 [Candidatus Naiadarchaeum limnaeum]
MGYKISEAIEKYAEQIKNAKKIAMQLPDGLKTKSSEIENEIRKYSNGAEIFVLGGSNFGGCDLRDLEAEKSVADLLLHFGHANFGVQSKIKTIYLEIQSDLNIEKAVQKAAKEIKEQKIGLITTIQHIESLEKAKEILEKNGKQVFTAQPKGKSARAAQLLGCDWSAGSALKDKVDCYLYIGTGNFHPLPLAIDTDKKVYVADPELNQVRELTDFKKKILKQIAIKIEKAKSANKFGILVTTKPGQKREKLAEKIKEQIENNGKTAQILVFDTIDYNVLQNLKLDAYVNTACPRIPLDDIEAFDKPILSPPELEIVLGLRKWEEYRLDHF